MSYTTSLSRLLSYVLLVTFVRGVASVREQAIMLSDTIDRKLYFGYGSNLWKEQMSLRCPDSTYLGVARLPGYKWIIYHRGYANIVKTENASMAGGDNRDEVFALVYSLSPSDESNLDRNEGVPVAYQKDMLDVEFWQAHDGDPVNVRDRSKMQVKSMLAYVDHAGTTKAKPKHEYIYRMNKGIHDALLAGVPPEYVERVMRRFIPEGRAAEMELRAREQALAFEDEN